MKTHELDVPRIGYVHAWQRTQDEGWWRAALDFYGVPYTYFADNLVRNGGLREKYDVLIYPHVGGSPESYLTGIPKVGPDPIPYKKTTLTPNLGYNDSSDDIRGGLGLDGLAELAKFVEAGGTLIGDGSSAEFFAQYGLAEGVSVEHPTQLFARGSILRGMITDAKSPIMYGYDGRDLPIYFNQDPVLNVAGAGGFGGGGGRGGAPTGADALAQNITPNVRPIHTSPYDGMESMPSQQPTAEAGGFGRGVGTPQLERPRVVMQFPSNPNDMLLSGTLAGGQTIANRDLVVDSTLGRGHVVLFALRPFWRWQTQGSYFLGFNAILNWNHLNAGKAAPGAGRGGRGTVQR